MTALRGGLGLKVRINFGSLFSALKFLGALRHSDNIYGMIRITQIIVILLNTLNIHIYIRTYVRIRTCVSPCVRTARQTGIQTYMSFI